MITAVVTLVAAVVIFGIGFYAGDNYGADREIKHHPEDLRTVWHNGYLAGVQHDNNNPYGKK